MNQSITKCDAAAVEVCFGIPKGQRGLVANLMYDAFGDILRLIFGDKTKALRFILAFLRDDRTLVAVRQGRVVGVAGVDCFGQGFLDAKAKKVAGLFGLGTFRLLLAGLVFFLDKAAVGEVHLQALAVVETERGKGTGTKLLNALIAYAKQNGVSQIRLEVTQVNSRAKQLYLRTGFEEVRKHRIPFPVSWFLGFSSFSEMILRFS